LEWVVMSDKLRNPKEPLDKRRRGLVRYKQMAALVEAVPLPAEEFAEIVASHREFIASGGGGGHWHTFATAGPGTGVVFGVYLGQEHEETAGAQAQLRHKRLEGLDLRGVQLPYADLSGVCCREQDLDGADLTGSLLTDADFSGSSFQGANLAGADFSRSELVRCNLRDADLAGADFENADLTGADLRGAHLEGAKFAGAAMESVLQ
jgi:hypothetical protein